MYVMITRQFLPVDTEEGNMITLKDFDLMRPCLRNTQMISSAKLIEIWFPGEAGSLNLLIMPKFRVWSRQPSISCWTKS